MRALPLTDQSNHYIDSRVEFTVASKPVTYLLSMSHDHVDGSSIAGASSDDLQASAIEQEVDIASKLGQSRNPWHCPELYQKLVDAALSGAHAMAAYGNGSLITVRPLYLGDVTMDIQQFPAKARTICADHLQCLVRLCPDFMGFCYPHGLQVGHIDLAFFAGGANVCAGGCCSGDLLGR